MSKQTLQTLKGFRDFLPEEALKRNYVIETITNVFENFGFDPMETPALEYSSVLLGKYGSEAENLMYLFKDRGGRDVGLRYDQTVPTARVVAQYQDIPKPFKRYQIQPVWRAENTQKGRYRELLQCDADIFGDSFAPTADAEILTLFWKIYKQLGIINVKIAVNSRQILKKIINEAFGEDVSEEIFSSIVTSIDKLDKLDFSEVQEELVRKEISEEKITSIFERIKEYQGFNYKDIERIDQNLYVSMKMAIESFGIPEDQLVFTPTLARGLNYYTGIIFESIDPEYKGSLGGGGRYDTLIKQLGGPDITAVGFAIGFDRTLEVADELQLLPRLKTNTKVLVAVKEDAKNIFSKVLNLVTQIRESGISTELYLNPQDKLEKQLKYANKKGIPFVTILGPDELQKNIITLKDMQTGDQEEMSIEELIKKLS